VSIVSSVIQRDGDHIVEVHTDHLGGKYTQTYFIPSDWAQEQLDAKVASHAAQIAESLAEGEAFEVIR